MQYDKQGRECPDPTPLEIPAGFNRPPTLQEQIERCIRRHMSAQAEAEGFESFEDANDFDTGDEDPTLSDTRYTDMGADEPYGGKPDASHAGGTGAGTGAAAGAASGAGTPASSGGGQPPSTGSGTGNVPNGGQSAQPAVGGNPPPV